MRSQGSVPEIYLLVPISLGSPFLCSAWSYHAPPGWGLSSYRRSQWHALLRASLVEEAGHWPITTLLLLSMCANWPSYCLNMSFGTQERSRRMKTFFLQTGNWGLEMAFVPGKAPKGPAGFQSLFDNSQLCGEQVLDKEGNNILDRDVNHKLSRGARFYEDLVSTWQNKLSWSNKQINILKA